jgi:hypothetical protein
MFYMHMGPSVELICTVYFIIPCSWLASQPPAQSVANPPKNAFTTFSAAIARCKYLVLTWTAQHCKPRLPNARHTGNSAEATKQVSFVRAKGKNLRGAIDASG